MAKRKRLTAAQFAKGYAERGGVTVEWLRQHGREARPCNCGDDICEGWQMAYVREDATRTPPLDFEGVQRVYREAHPRANGRT